MDSLNRVVISGFRGYRLTEASGGATNNSATNYPLVQIRRLDNEQIAWAAPSMITATAVTASYFNPLLVT